MPHPKSLSMITCRRLRSTTNPLLLSIGAVLFWSATTVAASKLGNFQGTIDPNSVTVSGLSSGGSFATQFHVAFSSTVQGAAIFAGTPYLCSWPHPYNLPRILRCTTLAATIKSASEMAANARSLSSAGRIDDVANMADDRVFVYHSKLDWNIVHPNSRLVVDFYRNFLVAGDSKGPDPIFRQDGIPSSHGFPTQSAGYPCYSFPLAPSLVLKCGYYGVFEALNFLYRDSLVRPAVTATNNKDGDAVVYTGAIVPFNQSDFLPVRGRSASPDSISMADTGFLYVPRDCQTAPELGGKLCKLHVAFHSCLQDASINKGRMILTAGYLELADANGIVVLFPQARITKTLPHNPLGCWDWYGYVDKDDSYPTKSAPQMATVFRMVESLLSPL